MNSHKRYILPKVWTSGKAHRQSKKIAPEASFFSISSILLAESSQNPAPLQETLPMLLSASLDWIRMLSGSNRKQARSKQEASKNQAPRQEALVTDRNAAAEFLAVGEGSGGW